jgi:hypothetical protein
MTTVLKTCDGLMKYKKLNHRSMCFREVLIRSPMHRHCDFSAGRFGTNDIVEVFEPFGDLNSNLYLQLRFVYELSLKIRLNLFLLSIKCLATLRASR